MNELKIDPAEVRPFRLPRELHLFAWALFLLNVLCGFCELLCRKVTRLHLDKPPYIYPFMQEYYPDYLLPQTRFRYFHSQQFFTDPKGQPFMYPAPLSLVYRMFYAAPHGGLKVFLAFIVVSLAAAGVLFVRALRRRGIAGPAAILFTGSVLALSFPVWFDLKQANMEIVIWLLVAGGIALFLAQRGYPAAVCFGIAASMKVYPAVYFGLLLVRKQYRQMIAGIAAGAGLMLVSLWLLGGSVIATWRHINENIALFRWLYMLHKRSEMAFDHSLLSLIKLAIRVMPAPERFAPVLTAYLAITVIAGLLIFFLRVWRLPVINQISFLTIVCIFLPPVSFEYALLSALIPLALILLLAVDVARSGGTLPGLHGALICFAVLLAPLSELIRRGRELDGQVKAIVFIVLTGIVLAKPFAPALSQDGTQGA